MTASILESDALEGLRTLPADHFHCVVTSPPYWGLRDYGVDGQMGLEPTPEEYVERMVDCFRAVRRVLRDDGTLWLNIGDSYNAYNGGAGPSSKLSKRQSSERPKLTTGYGLQCKSLKPKDLLGVPWMLAFALRSDGWWLRSDVIWAKRAPMPESVRDRPTKAHEYVFLLTKSQRYFYDSVASAEKSVSKHPSGNGFKRDARLTYQDDRGPRGNDEQWQPSETRNMRTVWSLGPESFPGAHFATMPTELARRCLLAGTSERGCCANCGAPFVRQVENLKAFESGSGRSGGDTGDIRKGPVLSKRTIGWERSCKCADDEPVPCRVLDPFNGAGTTGLVARRLQLHYVGIELNPEYAAMARKRIRDEDVCE